MFHIDDMSSMNVTKPKRFSKHGLRTSDPVACIAANKDSLVIARASGDVVRCGH